MTKTEFIQMITEFAKKEIAEHSMKASEELKAKDRCLDTYYAQIGAANEAEKFYNIIVRSFIEK